MRAAGSTHIGYLRRNNEDALYFPRKEMDVHGLYMVADGMGGHNAGEVASELAVHTAISTVAAARVQEDISPEEIVYQAIAEANRAVYRATEDNPEYSGMGTTLTLALDAGDKLVIGHVGDSRAYLLRDGLLQQVTTDHSLVQELLQAGRITAAQAATHPMRNVITRSLGSMRFVDIALYSVPFGPGDILLLCTDGLSNAVSDEDMAAMLIDEDADRQNDLWRAVNRLIDAALQDGGRDNITALVLTPTPERGGALT